MAKKKKKKAIILKKPLDFTLLITVFILLGLGIITVLSASSPTALAETGSSYAYVKKQLFFAGIGIILMLGLSKIDYKVLQRYARIFYIFSIILLFGVALFGVSSGGAKRWLNLGFFSFQPSEVMKLAVIVFFSAYLTKNKEKLKSIKVGFTTPIGLFLIIPAIVLGLQNHFSATLVMGLLLVILMILAGCRIRYFIIFGIPIVAIAIPVILYGGQGFRLERVITFMDPWKYESNEGWQIIQSLYAIGSGGMFGVGLGKSKQKYLYIPEPQNDFIFAVLAEELGFIGCAIVIILFAILIWRGITISMKAPDMFGSLVAAGISSMIAIQVIINIAVVTSSMPVTGMSLPFFSYGGTSLIVILASVGILLSVSRAGNREYE